jgi:hypothetical protein
MADEEQVRRILNEARETLKRTVLLQGRKSANIQPVRKSSGAIPDERGILSLPRPTSEQVALNRAILSLRDLEPFRLNTSEIQREFLQLAEDPKAQSLPPDLHRAILRLAADAASIVDIREKRSRQLVGAAGKAEYQSKVYQCLGDYEKCSGGHPTVLCASLFVVCIAQQLVPFAPS